MEWCDWDAAAMGLSAIYLRILRSACVRAEPVVSACVLEKSLKMRRYMTDRPMAAAVFGFEIYAEEVVVRWRNTRECCMAA